MQLRKILLLAGAVMSVAAVALAALRAFVSFTDPRLATVGHELHVSGEPFTGLVYELYPNKRPYRVATVWAGKRFGKEIHWYPNFARWVERDYVDGLPHGEFKTWYPDGKVQSLTRFEKGLAHGEFWSWHRNGRVIEHRVSDRGNEISYKAFTFDGKTFYNYLYRDGERVGVQAGQFCKSSRRPAN